MKALNIANSFTNRVLVKALFALLLPLCAAWGVAQAMGGAGQSSSTQSRSIEWPSQWDGAPLRPLALSDVEQRFAQNFPGHIGRMTDGHQTLVLRAVHQPTRMLHPATDCYRGLGYSLSQEQLERDAQQRLWRCFTATRSGRSQRVCERIVDAQGQAFTDTSAWYWQAVLGQSSGPWQAITLARSL
jgi:hypothetical protein